MSELDQLANLAAAADAGANAADAPIPESPQADPNMPNFDTEASGMVSIFAALIIGFCPKVEPLWGNDTQARVAQALSPVLQKYNFTIGGMPCELTLLIVAGSVLYQSARVIAAHLDEESKKAAKPSDKVVEAEATVRAAHEG